jgi:hypothetical protein
MGRLVVRTFRADVAAALLRTVSAWDHPITFVLESAVLQHVVYGSG